MTTQGNRAAHARLDVVLSDKSVAVDCATLWMAHRDSQHMIFFIYSPLMEANTLYSASLIAQRGRATTKDCAFGKLRDFMFELREYERR